MSDVDVLHVLLLLLFAAALAIIQGAGSSGFVPIREAVAWSRTTHGGRQLPLLAPPPEGGCFRWGMCEAPATDDNK